VTEECFKLGCFEKGIHDHVHEFSTSRKQNLPGVCSSSINTRDGDIATPLDLKFLLWLFCRYIAESLIPQLRNEWLRVHNIKGNALNLCMTALITEQPDHHQREAYFSSEYSTRNGNNHVFGPYRQYGG